MLRAPSKAGKVFISHSSKDKPFVDRLVSDLTARAIPVWYDKFDVRIGDSITGSINDALAVSKYFLIVLSPDAVSSRWVKEELNAALMHQAVAQGTFMIPVLLRDCSLPPLLAHRRYADFRTDYDAGLAEVLSVWGVDSSAEAKVPGKRLVPWPDFSHSDKEFLYLYSTRFDRFFRMSCDLAWTASATVDYVVSTLSLPWHKELAELGMRWSFSYGIVHNDSAITLNRTLKGAGLTNGDVIRLNISGTYEDVYEQELSKMWDGTKMYEMGGAMRMDQRLRAQIAARGPLTSERLRAIADSCFASV